MSVLRQLVSMSRRAVASFLSPVLLVLLIFLISCDPGDPVDQVAAQDIYVDNLYNMDGTPYSGTSMINTIMEYTFNAEEATTGTATGPAKATTSGANIDYTTLDYDDSSEEIAFWPWIVPDYYNGGTVQLTIHWVTSATAGAVYWGCGANEYADSDAFDVAWPEVGVTVTTTTDPNAGDLNTTTFSWFTPTPTWDAGDLVMIGLDRLAYLGPDTLIGDARVIDLNLEIHATL